MIQKTMVAVGNNGSVAVDPLWLENQALRASLAERDELIARQLGQLAENDAVIHSLREKFLDAWTRIAVLEAEVARVHQGDHPLVRD